MVRICRSSSRAVSFQWFEVGTEHVDVTIVSRPVVRASHCCALHRMERGKCRTTRRFVEDRTRISLWFLICLAFCLRTRNWRCNAAFGCAISPARPLSSALLVLHDEAPFMRQLREQMLQRFSCVCHNCGAHPAHPSELVFSFLPVSVDASGTISARVFLTDEPCRSIVEENLRYGCAWNRC